MNLLFDNQHYNQNYKLQILYNHQLDKIRLLQQQWDHNLDLQGPYNHRTHIQRRSNQYNHQQDIPLHSMNHKFRQDQDHKLLLHNHKSMLVYLFHPKLHTRPEDSHQQGRHYIRNTHHYNLLLPKHHIHLTHSRQQHLHHMFHTDQNILFHPKRHTRPEHSH